MFTIVFEKNLKLNVGEALAELVSLGVRISAKSPLQESKETIFAPNELEMNLKYLSDEIRKEDSSLKLIVIASSKSPITYQFSLSEIESMIPWKGGYLVNINNSQFFRLTKKVGQLIDGLWLYSNQVCLARDLRTFRKEYESAIKELDTENLAEQLSKVTEEKNESVKKQNYEKAANLRDKEKILLEEFCPIRQQVIKRLIEKHEILV
jgi:ribosomal protein S20